MSQRKMDAKSNQVKSSQIMSNQVKSSQVELKKCFSKPEIKGSHRSTQKIEMETWS